MGKEVEFLDNFGNIQKGTVFTSQHGDTEWLHTEEFISSSREDRVTTSISHSLIQELIGLGVVKDIEPKAEPQKEIVSLYDVVDDLIEKKEAAEKKLSDLTGKLKRKRAEFEAKMEEVEADILKGRYEGELIADADEAITVYHNLIDFINKITA
jgi:hypothetical protein